SLTAKKISCGGTPSATSVASRSSAACSSERRSSSSRDSALPIAVASRWVKSASRCSAPSGSCSLLEATTASQSRPATTIGDYAGHLLCQPGEEVLRFDALCDEGRNTPQCVQRGIGEMQLGGPFPDLQIEFTAPSPRTQRKLHSGRIMRRDRLSGPRRGRKRLLSWRKVRETARDEHRSPASSVAPAGRAPADEWGVTTSRRRSR